MRTSEKTDQIDAAMARVQARLAPVHKNAGVKVEGEKARWSSRYATYATLHAACKPHLVAENIYLSHYGEHAQGAGERLVTRLALSGQWVEASFPIKASRDGSQGFGGGISFAKRWGLACLVGLVTEDDDEEEQGYKDAKAAKPRQAKAPTGIAALIEAIRVASTVDDLSRAALDARSAHPIGEAAASVEKAISAWFIHALGTAADLDQLTELRDTMNNVRPRGNEVRVALADADKRLIGG